MGVWGCCLSFRLLCYDVTLSGPTIRWTTRGTHRWLEIRGTFGYNIGKEYIYKPKIQSSTSGWQRQGTKLELEDARGGKLARWVGTGQVVGWARC